MKVFLWSGNLGESLISVCATKILSPHVTRIISDWMCGVYQIRETQNLAEEGGIAVQTAESAELTRYSWIQRRTRGEKKPPCDHWLKEQPCLHKSSLVDSPSSLCTWVQTNKTHAGGGSVWIPCCVFLTISICCSAVWSRLRVSSQLQARASCNHIINRVFGGFERGAALLSNPIILVMSSPACNDMGIQHPAAAALQACWRLDRFPIPHNPQQSSQSESYYHSKNHNNTNKKQFKKHVERPVSNCGPHVSDFTHKACSCKSSLGYYNHNAVALCLLGIYCNGCWWWDHGGHVCSWQRAELLFSRCCI